MKIYENIIIGNFLFSLGYSISSKSGNTPFTGNINLLQQTPADHLLGDLIANLNNQIFLIEFKEASNRSNKELQRYKRLRTILDNEELSRLVPISKKMHWYIETSVTKQDLDSHTLISKIVPYLDMDALFSPVPNLLNSFVEQIAQDVTTPCNSYNIEDTEIYLDLVRKTLGSDAKCGSGGLLLTVSPLGEINYIAMEDLTDLRMTYDRWRESLQQSWEQKKELKKELTITHQKKLEKTGPSFEL